MPRLRHRRATSTGRASIPTLATIRAEWRTILGHVWRIVYREPVSMLAAAVAFYAFLSLPPALTLFVSIYGLIADAADVRTALETLEPMLPGQTMEVFTAQLQTIAESPKPSLGVGIAVSVLLGLWSSTRGIRALLVACNEIDAEGHRRGILALNRLAVGITTVLMLFGAGAFALVVLVPAVFAMLPALPATAAISALLRWPLLALLMMLTLALLYQYAPNRPRGSLRLVSWGSACATLLWLAASGGLSTFVRHFGRYNEIYGALAGVVLLMLWLFVSSWSILLGAALNAALRAAAQRQREADDAGRDGT
ncbi:MAG TPA: YihY/virulence factor BrkB family protein [Thermoanaerobaculia bacterium]|nr:YihY/virulence factor BrkB family protein [Thermoanaerobaculia bacterium]